MTKRDRIANLGREEHEFRETLRHRKAKLRKFKKGGPSPRSLRAKRSAEAADQVGSPAQIASTAASHRDADEICGREWTCQCGACRITRTAT